MHPYWINLTLFMLLLILVKKKNVTGFQLICFSYNVVVYDVS